MLGARNSSQKDGFFTKGRLNNLDVSYSSQSYFGLPRQNIRNTSDRITQFKQTLRDVESIFKDIGGYEMKYQEFKKIRRKAGSEKFNHLCADTARKTRR